MIAHPVAMVTGASRGLGSAAAERLAADGFAVAVCHEPDPARAAEATEVAERISSRGGLAQAFAADLGEPEEIDRLIAEVTVRFGRLDVLIANAAIDRVVDWEQLPPAEWDTTFDVNVRATWLLARAAAPWLRVSGSASIVTVSSIMAVTGTPGRLPYSTSKAAIIGLTRVLARTLGADGIRVNCVMPGAIRTESETERFTGVDDDVIALQSLKRRGLAVDVAGVFSFLAGPDAAFVTGQTICVDGGREFL